MRVVIQDTVGPVIARRSRTRPISGDWQQCLTITPDNKAGQDKSGPDHDLSKQFVFFE